MPKLFGAVLICLVGYWSGEFAEDTVPLVLDWLRETAGPAFGR